MIYSLPLQIDEFDNLCIISVNISLQAGLDCIDSQTRLANEGRGGKAEGPNSTWVGYPFRKLLVL